MANNKYSIVHKLIIIFCVILILMGIIVIILASVSIKRQLTYEALFDKKDINGSILIMMLGTFIMMNGMFGIWGIVYNNINFLYIYPVIGAILFMIELVVGIFVVVTPKRPNRGSKRKLDREFRKYGRNITLPANGELELSGRAPIEIQIQKDVVTGTPAFENTNFINTVQRNAECCGLDSHKDWALRYRWDMPPVSCCKSVNPCDTRNATNIFQEGCYDRLVSFLEMIVLGVAYGAIILACFQFIVMILAFILEKKQSRAEKQKILG